MFRFLFCIALGLVEFSFYSCSNAKPISQQEIVTTDQCRLVISFISKGRGIDRDTKKNVLAYIENYNKTHSLTLVYETVRWGREGEVDFCFALEELKKRQQVKFIDELKTLVQKSDCVRISENSEKRKGLSIK